MGETCFTPARHHHSRRAAAGAVQRQTEKRDASASLARDGIGSPSYILLYHPDRRVAERAVAQCVAEIERLEQAFSLYRDDSEIVRLNCHGYLEAPSHDLLALLSECQSFSELSGGAFDVTVQPLWNVYAAHFFGSASPSPQGPEPRAIAEALALVDWQGVDIAFRRISLARPGMGLTLNGIAQGYLTDRIADILRVNGCDRVLADMGRSEILLVGCRPDGQAWRIALTDPLASERVAVTLELADRCISTRAVTAPSLKPQVDIIISSIR